MNLRITRLLLGVVFFFPMTTLLAQAVSGGAITGKVKDPKGQPVEFANVILNKLQDSSLVKVEVTNEEGVFALLNVADGDYLLKVSFVGFPEFRTGPLKVGAGQTLELPLIQLQDGALDLKEVTVAAQRPMLETKPDRMVFNVDGSINAAGSNGLELLRKAPGIVVDNNDNITMLGRSGVQIYIDGKPSPLRGADLADFLKSLQSTEIDAIELVTNPSARFDAQGNAGVINIKLKKDRRLGANGSANTNYSVGVLPIYSAGFNGNYQDKGYNLFGSYNYNNSRSLNYMTLYREQLGVIFDQTSDTRGESENHNFKIGTDFFLSKKHTLGFLVNGFNNQSLYGGTSRTPISRTGLPGIDSVLLASTNSDNQRSNYNLNLNYRFDSGKGVVWNVDADYGRFRSEALEYQPNRYVDGSEEILLSEKIFANNTPTGIDIYTLKTDYERPLWKGQFGAGVKFAFVNTDNTFDFFDVVDDQDVLNRDLSNQFAYEENVNAAYATYSKQGKKLGFNLGVRMEQTNSTGTLTAFKPTDNDKVERSYLDFFPSGGITFNPSKKHSLNLSYSRRINRPSYQDLNPFQNRLDELTFEQGNPFLKPEYVNNIQFRHTFNYRFNTTLSYSHTQDQITRFTDTSGVKSTYITWLNLANQHAYSLAFSAPVQIKSWWSSFTNATVSYSKNQADYGGTKIVDLEAATFNIYSQQTFTLPKSWSLEVSGWYNSPGLWGGTFEMESMWSIDAGVQKKLLAGRGNLKLSVTDIFKTTEWNGISRFGVLNLNVGGGWDSRRLRMAFSYQFGRSEVKAARRRSTGLEDEQKRVKSDN